MISQEFPHAAAPIADAIDAWLVDERVSSGTGGNAYLDELDVLRATILLPIDDITNLNAQKYYSHHNRQHVWGDAMVMEPDNDYFTARHIFNGLMQLSGGARRIHYLSATDQEDYINRKLTDHGSGIDTEGTVQASMDVLPTFPTPTEAQVVALGSFLHAEVGLTILQTRVPEDFGAENSPAVDVLRDLQQSWIHAVTTGIFMAAGIRNGRLEKVPFLEPKTITEDPEIYYPFAS